MSDDKKAMTVQEAGRRGGQAVREKYGPNYYSEIGRKGGQAIRAERGRDFYVAIGRKGGAATKARGQDYSALGKRGSVAREAIMEAGRVALAAKKATGT